MRRALGPVDACGLEGLGPGTRNRDRCAGHRVSEFDSLGVEHKPPLVGPVSAIACIAQDWRALGGEVDPDLVFPSSHGLRLNEEAAGAPLEHPNQRQRGNPGTVDANGAAVGDTDRLVDTDRRRPVDRRHPDERHIGLGHLPLGETVSQRGVRFGGLGEENHARGGRIKSMMDKDAAAHVPFDELGQARAVHVPCLMSRKARWLVDRDEPPVLEQDRQTTRTAALRWKPFEAPHEH